MDPWLLARGGRRLGSLDRRVLARWCTSRCDRGRFGVEAEVGEDLADAVVIEDGGEDGAFAAAWAEEDVDQEDPAHELCPGVAPAWHVRPLGEPERSIRWRAARHTDSASIRGIRLVELKSD